MLSPRYVDDGEPLLDLTSSQLQAKRSVEEKVHAGRYAFEAAACPVCGKSGGEPLAAKDRCGLRSSVVLCTTCGLVRTDPRMTAEAFREFYNHEYRVLHDRDSTPREAFARELRRGRRIARYLDRHGIAPGPGRSFAVEVGCGSGGILAALRRRGWEVLGLDLAADRLEYGRRCHGLDLVPGALDQTALPRRPHLVLYSHVLEHIPEPAVELARLRASLAPGGVVYVEVPGIKRLDVGYEDDLLRYLQNAHCFHFSLATLTNLMCGCGFERIAGDEEVRCLFRPSTGPCPGWEDDRSEVLRELMDAERRRRRFHAKVALRQALKRLGLFPLARRAVRWFVR